MRFTLKNLRFLQYIDYQTVRKAEFLGCQSQDRHPVGRPVDVIGGKGEADDPSFSSFVNPCRADDSPELDTVNTFRFHNIIDYASNSRCLRCFKRALLASEKEIC